MPQWISYCDVIQTLNRRIAHLPKPDPSNLMANGTAHFLNPFINARFYAVFVDFNRFQFLFVLVLVWLLRRTFLLIVFRIFAVSITWLEISR